MFRVFAEPEPAAAPAGLAENVRAGAYDGRLALRELVQLAADTTFGILGALVRPHRIRWRPFAMQCLDIGARALPIVALIVFLVGLTVAFQAAFQLRQFGAAIYVADLTAVSVVR